ncbi:hypothetical protein HaLaN_04280 [Haematococcus lacustris]|uniref:Uncharacterized protein n=1 Tax=Haematococcus lacustris TaxID=44745 RepID=A0A699YI74_HAELA|nr:hypothetical protein HaLaN_04280 [Haematococcus lacustris]
MADGHVLSQCCVGGCPMRSCNMCPDDAGPHTGPDVDRAPSPEAGAEGSGWLPPPHAPATHPGCSR